MKVELCLSVAHFQFRQALAVFFNLGELMLVVALGFGELGKVVGLVAHLGLDLLVARADFLHLVL